MMTFMPHVTNNHCGIYGRHVDSYKSVGAHRTIEVSGPKEKFQFH